MKITYNNQTNTEKFQGNKYGALLLTLYTVKGVVASPLIAGDINLLNCTIKAELHRTVNGKMEIHTIFNGNLAPLAFAASYPTAQYGYVDPAATGNTMYTILEANGGAIKEKGIRNFKIPFGGVIDTSGNTGGKIVVTILNGASFTSTSDTALSYIQSDLLEVEGVETYLPSIICESIEANQVSPTFAPNDLVRRVHYVNLDKVSSLTADQVISQMTIQHSGSSRNVNYNELLNLRSAQFEGMGQEERNQSFDLLRWSEGGKYYKNVVITSTLNTVEVVASQNWFVAWTARPSAGSLIQWDKAETQNAIQTAEIYQSAKDSLVKSTL